MILTHDAGSEVGRPRSRNPHPQSPSTQTATSITVDALTDLFLGWLKAHRSERTHRFRREHLGRLRKSYGTRLASSLKASDLEAFLSPIAHPDYARKHEVSVKAMIAWGVKHGHLPAGFKPFATLEAIRCPAKVLLESDLPTVDEVNALIQNAIPALADFLLVQHATGARTGELMGAKVGDYQPRQGQIVIKNHKREKTMRSAPIRVITLNADAVAIVSRLANGRPQDAPLFPTAKGRKWRLKLLGHHYRRARVKAGVREAITPYSLRHLWISESLMAGVDAFLVAKMAGTSVSMVEKVYGRFRTQSLNDAQARLDALRSGA